MAQERRRRKSLVAAANRVKQGSAGAPGRRDHSHGKDAAETDFLDLGVPA